MWQASLSNKKLHPLTEDSHTSISFFLIQVLVAYSNRTLFTAVLLFYLLVIDVII